jgi:hypothetical protein
MRPVYPFSLHLVITLLGIVGILGPQSATFSSDPGTGWHLKSGEIMRGLSAPLFIDPFLALPSGISQRMWICDQWLSDILFSLAYSVSGFEGLNLIVTALFITTFFVFLYQELTLLRPGNPTLYSSVAVSVACLLSFKLAQVHFILRPVVLFHTFYTGMAGEQNPCNNRYPFKTSIRFAAVTIHNLGKPSPLLLVRTSVA